MAKYRILLCFWFLLLSLAELCADTPEMEIEDYPAHMLEQAQPDFSQSFVRTIGAATVGNMLTFPVLALGVDIINDRVLKFNPSHLYQGVLGSTLRFAPTTAGILMVSEAFGVGDPEATFTDKLMGATAGGLVGAAVSSPFELMLSQQRLGTNNRTEMETIRDIYQKAGMTGFARGLKYTLVRDLFYTYGMLLLPDVIRPYMPGEEGGRFNNGAATTIGGITAGFATLYFELNRGISHRIPIDKKPLDFATVIRKTNQESDKFLKLGVVRAVRFAALFPTLILVGDEIRNSQILSNLESIKGSSAPAPSMMIPPPIESLVKARQFYVARKRPFENPPQ